MSQDISQNLFQPAWLNPFMAWTDLAMKTTEAMVESGQVIGSRVDQLTRAGANAEPAELKQYSLLGTDKPRAATESGLAMVSRLQSAQYDLMTRAWQQWFNSLAAMVAMAGSSTFGEVLSRQQRLFQSLAAPRTATRTTSDRAVEPAPAAQAHARRHRRVSRTGVAASRR